MLEGKDLLGIAQTGTGKTAAFALPILHRLAADPHGRRPGTTRVLVLVPTRELAIQVRESFDRYGCQLGLHTTCIFGGVGDRPQKDAMARGVDIVVATPGRLLDLLSQRALTLKTLSILVLDEADRMLDMGFIHDIRKIIAQVPAVRQNLFFSATMPHDIARLSASILRNPVRIEVTPSATPIEIIDQIVYEVPMKEKQHLLIALLNNRSITRALVFTRTKHGANKLCDGLLHARISAAAIHGNKSQNRRQEALAGFQSGQVRILVATDIAARGIDVDEVSHVFNFDIPEISETYVHRIGRTARAGASGSAVSFCDPQEYGDLAAIERIIRRKIPRGDARSILKTAVIAPDSIHSTTGRYDRDLNVYLPPAAPRAQANPENAPSRNQGFRPPAHRNYNKARPQSPSRGRFRDGQNSSR